MKTLILASLLALSTSAVFAEDAISDKVPNVLDRELHACDVLVSYYTPYTFEQVEQSFVRYTDTLRSWYSPKSSEVFTKYQFNRKKWATCTSWFHGNNNTDATKIQYDIVYRTSLNDNTLDIIKHTVHVEWVWNEKTDIQMVETYETKYINDKIPGDHENVENDPKLRKILLDTLEETKNK